MLLMPPPPGTCPVCARKHEPSHPHDGGSIYYNYRFYGMHGRWPTWQDAIARCDAELKSLWEAALRKLGRWTEPADGSPIADPPAESVRQPIGDVNSRTFKYEEPA